MIKKQNLWFLTLFSLILVLSVYYITMPNDLLLDTVNNKVNTKISKNKKDSTSKTETTKETIEQTDSLTAMRVSLEEEREEVMADLQKQLTDEEMTAEEKNNAYEQLKYLNELEGKEENLEKKIKKNFNISSFVKIDNNEIEVVAVSKKHDNTLANNIMRTIQEEYKDKMYITVKFQ